MTNRLPENQGLYSRDNEHDACGIGFVADIKGRKSNEIVRRGLEVVVRMEHRGAESADNKNWRRRGDHDPDAPCIFHVPGCRAA